MASLNGQTPADTYEGLLKLYNNGTMPSGISAPTTVSDGAGNPSDLRLHEDCVEITRLSAGGTFGFDGQYLGQTGSGNLKWKDDGLIPNGGLFGQVLRKINSENRNYSWQSVNEVPSGGTTNQVLTKTASGYAWANSGATEFGTFTPDLTNGYGAGNTNSPQRVGHYVKIGNWAYLTGKINTQNGAIFSNDNTGPSFSGVPFSPDTTASINKNFNFNTVFGWPPPPPAFSGFLGGSNGRFTIVSSTGVFITDGHIVGYGSFNKDTPNPTVMQPYFVAHSSSPVSVPNGAVLQFQFAYKTT
jgi:hypothetical protein